MDFILDASSCAWLSLVWLNDDCKALSNKLSQTEPTKLRISDVLG